MIDRGSGIDGEELRQSVSAAFARSRFGVLATCGETTPHQSLVAIAVTDDFQSIVFVTERTTRKYANLLANPRAAMLIDTRQDVGDDLDRGVAVMATGVAEELTGSRRENLARALLERHPYMSDFVAQEPCALLWLRVGELRLARGLSSVVSVELGGERAEAENYEEGGEA